MENASIQMQAHQLADGGEVEFLNDEEAEKSSRGRNVPRAVVAVEASVQQDIATSTVE